MPTQCPCVDCGYRHCNPTTGCSSICAGHPACLVCGKEATGEGEGGDLCEDHQDSHPAARPDHPPGPTIRTGEDLMLLGGMRMIKYRCTTDQSTWWCITDGVKSAWRRCQVEGRAS